MKPLPLLSHMPWTVLQSIVDVTDNHSKLSLRKCCHRLRSAVDNSVTNYKSVTILFENNTITLKSESDNCCKIYEYRPHQNGCLVSYMYDEREKFIQGGDYLAMAVADFLVLIRSPKVNVRNIMIYYRNQMSAEYRIILANVQRALATLEHTLNVESFGGNFEIDSLMELLSFVNPETLSELNVTLLGPGIERLVGSEYWRRAKRLYLYADRYPIFQMAHFTSIHLKSLFVSRDIVKLFIENALEHGEHFQDIYSTNVTFENKSEIVDYLSNWKEASLDPGYPVWFESYSIRIPNSNRKLKLKMFDQTFSMSLGRLLERSLE